MYVCNLEEAKAQGKEGRQGIFIKETFLVGQETYGCVTVFLISTT